MAQVDVGDPHVGKAELGAPRLDGARECRQVWWKMRHEDQKINKHGAPVTAGANNTIFYSMQQFKAYLPDEDATNALGAALARALVPGLVVYLHGDLGAGKTALTRALLRAAGHKGTVKSPTYTLSEPYAVMLDGAPVNVIHYDLYRMSSPEEFLDAGFREDFDGNNICIVEWPEKGEPVLPAPDVSVWLTVAGAGRAVELQALSHLGLKCLDRLAYTPPH
jgi:tRNA threonylcarbamoyladenosine biosynthesis protein TsaE